jgi:hypothetical protein
MSDASGSLIGDSLRRKKSLRRIGAELKKANSPKGEDAKPPV